MASEGKEVLETKGSEDAGAAPAALAETDADAGAGGAAGGSKMAVVEVIDSTETGAGGDDGVADGAGGAGVEETTHITFNVADASFKFLADRELKAKLQQWNVDEMSRFHVFRFDRRFNPLELDAFLLDFFNSKDVRTHFQPLAAAKTETPFAGVARSVKHTKLATTQLSMDFFDRLQKEGLVSASGSIKKRFDEDFDGVTVGDDVREMLVNPDSENEEVYSEAEKSEFLYHVFRRVTVGGPMCQFEDSWEAYLAATKAMYKELVSVHRRPSGDIEVGSTVLQVTGLDCDTPLWPKDNDHNFLYLSIDPLKRRVIVWYGAFVSWW